MEPFGNPDLVTQKQGPIEGQNSAKQPLQQQQVNRSNDYDNLAEAAAKNSREWKDQILQWKKVHMFVYTSLIRKAWVHLSKQCVYSIYFIAAWIFYWISYKK